MIQLEFLKAQEYIIIINTHCPGMMRQLTDIFIIIFESRTIGFHAGYPKFKVERSTSIQIQRSQTFY